MSMPVQQPPNLYTLIRTLEAKQKAQIEAHNQSIGWMHGAQAKIDYLTGIADVIKGMDVTRIGGGGGGGGGSGRAHGPVIKSWGSFSNISLDQVPGKAMPYEMTCDIKIDAGATDVRQGSIQNNTDGPFVAVGRYAIFRSLATFTHQDAQTAFLGRTNGRFRPISSALDTQDVLKAFDQLSQYMPPMLGAVIKADDTIIPVFNPIGVNPGSVDGTNTLPNFPGTARPYVASPSNASPYRSMGFDGLIAYETKGSNYRRSWKEAGVPSHFWEIQRELACYDVFEPAETIVFNVTPLHPNNPEFGNIQSLGVINAAYDFNENTGAANNNPFPVGVYPYRASQYDGHEGINDETLTGDLGEGTVDRVTRAYNGILTLGFWGYKLLQATQVSV